MGVIGHRIVGRVAEQHLSDEARQQLQTLLGPESLAQVSTWPDEIRADLAWHYANPWHYVNIADDDTYETRPRGCGGGDPAVHDRPQDKVVAVKFRIWWATSTGLHGAA